MLDQEIVLEAEQAELVAAPADYEAPNTNPLAMASAYKPPRKGVSQLLERVLTFFRQRTQVAVGVTFGIGLLIGWLIIGSLVLPFGKRNAGPWNMSQDDQVLYLTLVAEEYWRTGDTKIVYDALDGWDQDELTKLLTGMLSSSELSAENRQHVLGLVESLDLAAYEQPLLASLLLNNMAIILTALLSTVPMVMAVAVVMSPIVKEYVSEEGRSAIADAIASAMGGDDEDGDEEELSFVGLGSLIEEETDDLGEFEDIVIDDDEDSLRESEEEVQSGGDYVLNKPIGIQSIMGGPGSGGPEETVDVTDMISELFEDDDEDAEKLEALARQLPRVDIDGLLSQAREVAETLAKMNMSQARAA